MNSRISAREVSRDFRRSDLWSRQNIAFRIVASRAAFRTSAIAATTGGASVGAAGFLPRGSAASVWRGRVFPMCGSSGSCTPKFQELPRPGEPVDAEVRAVAEDSAAPQRQREREDERGVVVLEVVVDAGLQVEPAQLEQRAPPPFTPETPE